jgi:hypothetical protein
MRLLNLQDGYRRLDIYRNRIYSLPGMSDHVFFNAWSWINKNSEAEIYFYHNSISGGREALLMADFNPGYGMPKTYILNNIISAESAFNAQTTLQEKKDIGLFDYNWIGGVWLGARKWFGNSNIVVWNKKMWNNATLPDFALPSGSEARNAGIDLSKPFIIDGITYPALPGMTPGYFSGSKPDLGAVQSQPGKPVPPSNLRTTQ